MDLGSNKSLGSNRSFVNFSTMLHSSASKIIYSSLSPLVMNAKVVLELDAGSLFSDLVVAKMVGRSLGPCATPPFQTNTILFLRWERCE
jgi:hypothetical protein